MATATAATLPHAVGCRILLQRPFDIRSLALTGLFILALFYTLYFARAVLLPVVLAPSSVFSLRRSSAGWPGCGFARRSAPPSSSSGLSPSIGYGISFLAAPAAGWLEKAPYGLQQLEHKLMPLKKPIAQVAQAGGEIDKLTSPDGAKPVADRGS